MKNVKYVYNEHTLQYEEHKLSRREKFRKSLYFTSAVVLTSVLMFVFAYQYFPTPKEKVMEKEKEQFSDDARNFCLFPDPLRGVEPERLYLPQLRDAFGFVDRPGVGGIPAI